MMAHMMYSFVSMSVSRFSSSFTISQFCSPFPMMMTMMGTDMMYSFVSMSRLSSPFPMMVNMMVTNMMYSFMSMPRLCCSLTMMMTMMTDTSFLMPVSRLSQGSPQKNKNKNNLNRRKQNRYKHLYKETTWLLMGNISKGPCLPIASCYQLKLQYCTGIGSDTYTIYTYYCFTLALSLIVVSQMCNKQCLGSDDIITAIYHQTTIDHYN